MGMPFLYLGKNTIFRVQPTDALQPSSTLRFQLTHWRHFTVCRMSENNQSDQELLVEGILDLNENKSEFFLDPSRGGRTTPHDPFVPRELIRRFKLKKGSVILADAVPDKARPNPKMVYSYRGRTVAQRPQKIIQV